MKKLISCLALALAIAQGVAVSAAVDSPFYELELVSAGALTKGAYNATDAGTVTVQADTDESLYVAVVDKDAEAQVGLAKEIELGGVQTVSFDYRLKGTNNARLYVGDMADINLASSISYLKDGVYAKTPIMINTGEWVNVSLVIDAGVDTFDLYIDGYIAAENIPSLSSKGISGKPFVSVVGLKEGESHFDIKNFKFYKGEVVPAPSEKMKPYIVNPDRTLVSFVDAVDPLNAALENAVAMTVGNSVARVNNSYVSIDPLNEYVAPFITADGHTLIPTRFTTEAIGCEVEVLSDTSFRFSKDGIVMEINMGDKFATINGEKVEMPTYPQIKYDRLFIPLRFAAETFSKNVFWDDRGLIIISDEAVIEEGNEALIKPLITFIRQHTTLYGNKKYSDVTYTSRSFHPGTLGDDGEDYGTLDAAKRFMATDDRWSYVLGGDNGKSIIDLGILLQGTINAQVRDSDEIYFWGGERDAMAYFIDGERYVRADGGIQWGCVNNPYYLESIKIRAQYGMDHGVFAWQFDDWTINAGYASGGGCQCDYCNEAFKEYLKNDISPEDRAILAEAGITDLSDFDFRAWEATQGTVDHMTYVYIENHPIHKVRRKFLLKKAAEFHEEVISYMTEYSGTEPYYCLNGSIGIAMTSEDDYSAFYRLIQGTMAESGRTSFYPEAVYEYMLLSRPMNMENVYSPLPTDTVTANYMYAGIAMSYATGQTILIPWDAWLYGSTRYWADVEELGGLYEFARENPFLFDNYEIPEVYGYAFNMDESSSITDYAKHFLNGGLPVRSIIRKSAQYPFTFDGNDLSGLHAVVLTDDLANFSEAERATLENSGVLLLTEENKAEIDYLENTYWTVKDSDADVYAILRTNQLYDDAPVVVHAVNYDFNTVKHNVEIELNNLWLPQGDELTVNFYRPGENVTSATVKRGEGGVTKIVVDSIDLWTVVEVSGAATQSREASFNIGGGFSGIGMGTRISKDKAYGTADNFTIVTYSEGINSTTLGDITGTQDEAAFVYKKLDSSILKKSSVSAGFGEAGGEYGVMIRGGIYSNARFIALMYDKENGLRLAHRDVTNKGVIYENLGDTEYEYLKLEKDREVYNAYVSNDGENYILVTSIPFEFESAVGGVFAASETGSRAECNVHGLNVTDGSYIDQDFTKFEVSYESNELCMAETNEHVNIVIETTDYKDLTLEDVDVQFTSTDESVAYVTVDGLIVPAGEGEATITATASMGDKKASSSFNLKVTPIDPILFNQDFSDGTLGDLAATSMTGNVDASTGVIKITANNTGEDVNANGNIRQFEKPTVVEFDFRAHFGTDSPTTGARLIYLNGDSGICVTADPNGFNWFFGSEQTHVMDIEEDRWYKIKIEVDYDKQVGSLYIDGEKVVDNGILRGTPTPDGRFKFGGWRIGTDSSYEWDNIKIYFVDSFDNY